MSDENRSDRALDDAIEALLLADVERELERLVTGHPQSWRASLARLRALPSPARPDSPQEIFRPRCRLLSKAAGSLLSTGRLCVEEHRWIDSLALETARAAATFGLLRQFLQRLSFFKASLPTMTYRLGVLVEHQARMGEKLALTRGTIGGDYHPWAPLDESLVSKTGGVSSILASYEGMVEAVELVLRYAWFTSPSDTGAQFEVCSPFEDPDLEAALRAAGVWNAAAESLDAVKFGGWRTHADTNHACFSPPDQEEYLRWQVAQVRQQAVVSEFSLSLLADGQTDRRETLTALAHSIELPPAGEVWNGKYDAVALKSAARKPYFQVQAENWVVFRHYEQYAGSVELPPKRLPWTTWLRAISAIHVLSQGLALAVDARYPSLPEGVEGAVVVATQESILSVLQDCGLEELEAASALAALSFSPKRRSFELWDQPLLPLGSGRVLIVPGLILSANPVRMLENAISEWGEKTPGKRGSGFEKRLAAHISSLGLGASCGNITFVDTAGSDLECDVIWWWDGVLFLIEAKCLKSVHSYAEFAGARADIDEAFDQLERRRAAVQDSWSSLRERAPELLLPDEPIALQSIVCLVVTNVLCFTGWATRGAVVVDDIAFARYFGDASVDATTVTRDRGEVRVGSLGVVRAGPPSSRGFVDYVSSPPQVSSVREQLSIRVDQCPSSHEVFPVWRVSAAFSAQRAMLEFREAKTRARAHELWCRRGKPENDSWADWFAAESELS